MNDKIIVFIKFNKIGFNTIIKRTGMPKLLQKILWPVPRKIKENILISSKGLRKFILDKIEEYLQNEDLDILDISNLNCAFSLQDKFEISVSLSNIDYEKLMNLFMPKVTGKITNKNLKELAIHSIDYISKNVEEDVLNAIVVEIINNMPNFLLQSISEYLKNKKIIAEVDAIECQLQD